MPLDFASIEDALYTWAFAQLGMPVFWSNQKFPQPARPYATLKLTGPRVLSGSDAAETTTDLGRPAGEEVETKYSGPRELTCSVQVYAVPTSGASSARALLARAQASLSRDSVAAALRAAGLAIVDQGGIADLTALLETNWESRAAMDVRLGCTDSATDRTGYIETVELVDDLT